MYFNFGESEIGTSMNAHEFINYELEYDLNNPCIPIAEEITGMLDEGDDATHNDRVEEVGNVQIDDVLVDTP